MNRINWNRRARRGQWLMDAAAYTQAVSWHAPNGEQALGLAVRRQCEEKRARRLVRRRERYREQLLEAAQRVEEGSWP